MSAYSAEKNLKKMSERERLARLEAEDRLRDAQSEVETLRAKLRAAER